MLDDINNRSRVQLTAADKVATWLCPIPQNSRVCPRERERERERERALYWLHWVLLHSCDKYHVFTCLLSVRSTTGLDSEGALYSCPHSALLQLWCNLESCCKIIIFFFSLHWKSCKEKNAGTKLHHSRTLMQWTVLYGCPGRIGMQWQSLLCFILSGYSRRFYSFLI